MAGYIAAVSGGVDSVVLLDMLVRANHEVVVAHVEHGMRDDSLDDARFVRALAEGYGCIYEEKSLNLGAGASEQKAREARYKFLFDLAKKHQAVIVTAHHGDDLAETVAINLTRGTGWRGLAVLNRQGIYRPLLSYSKNDLYEYAIKNHLEWVEDKTNSDHRYLRNRIRSRLRPRLTWHNRQALANLRDRQVALNKEIMMESKALLSQNNNLRYLITNVDMALGVELLGEVIVSATGVKPQRPQLERALIAVKTAKTGAAHHVGDKIMLRFTIRDFSVEVLQ